MQKITWDIQYLSPPPAIKYCKKCGKKTEYLCSGLFRINAQRKYLDIWLIYKCLDCDSTWNMTIYSRINPKNVAPKILDGFYSNNGELAKRYAMDIELIRRNGAEIGLPKYKILGANINFGTPIELHIKSSYPSRLKVSSLLREKMNLSQNTFKQMINSGSIRSVSGLNLKKCRLQADAILIIDKWPIEG
ncbi:DUF1062 domain-containing protein [Maledivibacter halophilus]|uniref:DUF1062 domain-containing protein n=1 Tax=Maledivibacter halophilus TaxID=36842 RepID=A0A1T5MM50_9FIRM|nr:DUF1062 domain-containing protein [Maledivibacter halophilus]SKC89295.1 hypothetical protein SAMN02194393_05003 [Maledivibacter halophilus]